MDWDTGAVASASGEAVRSGDDGQARIEFVPVSFHCVAFVDCRGVIFSSIVQELMAGVFLGVKEGSRES